MASLNDLKALVTPAVAAANAAKETADRATTTAAQAKAAADRAVALAGITLVEIADDPIEPNAIYLLVGGALLWLSPDDYRAFGAPQPALVKRGGRLAALPIVPGTPDPRRAA